MNARATRQVSRTLLGTLVLLVLCADSRIGGQAPRPFPSPASAPPSSPPPPVSPPSAPVTPVAPVDPSPLTVDSRARRRHEAPPPRIAAPAAVKVGIAGPGGYTMREVELEEYVAGVLTGEAARDSDPAVLQALAVAIRTYALKNLQRHRAEGFDVCDETHCQVLRRPTAVSTAAAQATAGRVLTWRGALAIVYYSASCGGHTQVPSAVWPGAEDPPYLPSRQDDGCGGTPEWTAEVSRADLERTLRANGFRGSLKRVRVASRDRSGRVTRLKVDGMTPSQIPGTNLRMAVGPTLIKSVAFDLEPGRDRYVFHGHGYGHGVGMCVIGATRLAARGETAEQLLARYFPGTILGLVDTGDPGARPTAVPTAASAAGTPAASSASATAVPARPAAVPASSTVVTPSAPSTPAAPAAPTVPAAPAGAPAGADREDAIVTARREVEALATNAGRQLASTLGVSPPAPVALVLHPSDESYERASGRHWFTFAAFTRGALHLMPIDQLRQRGVLERVIRREMVHALVDNALASRPQWVRDGAALYYADPAAGGAAAAGAAGTVDAPRGDCPADADLLQPVSAGALAQAYARAVGCFSRQVRNGRAWRDVR